MAMARVQEQSKSDRINYYRVCRVIVDHVPTVLRRVFKDRVLTKHSHPWDDTPICGGWMYRCETHREKLSHEQKEMIKNGDTSKWDPTLIFHALLYSSLGLLVDQLTGVHVIKGTSNVLRVTQIPPFWGKGQGLLIEVQLTKKVISTYHTIQKVSNTDITIKPRVRGTIICVSLCCKEWEATDQLRVLRNTKFAHKNKGETSEKDLSDLITCVTSHFQDLGMSQGDIDQLEAIKIEPIADTKYVQELHQRWSQERTERMSQLEKDVADLQQTYEEQKDRLEELDSDSAVQGQEIQRQIQELSDEQKALQVNVTDRFDELLQSQYSFKSEVMSRGAELKHIQHQQSTKIKELEARMDGYEGGQRELYYPRGSVVQRRVSERRELALSEQPQTVAFVNLPSGYLQQLPERISVSMQGTGILVQNTNSPPGRHLALPAPPSPVTPEDLRYRINKNLSSDARAPLPPSSTHSSSKSSSVPSTPVAAASPQESRLLQHGHSGTVAATPPGPGTPLLSLIPNPVEYKEVQLESIIKGKLQCSYLSPGSECHKCTVTFTFSGRRERVTSDYFVNKVAAKESAISMAYDRVQSIISPEPLTSRSASSASGYGAQFNLEQVLKRKGLRAPKYEETKSSVPYSYQYQVFAPRCGCTPGDHCHTQEEAKESAASKVLEKLVH